MTGPAGAWDTREATLLSRAATFRALWDAPDLRASRRELARRRGRG